MGIVIFAYGLLASFVISGASRNRRTSSPNPAMLRAVGHVLTGLSLGSSFILFGCAVMGVPIRLGF